MTYCMGKLGAELSDHPRWSAQQVKVGDVLFAMLEDIDGRPAISFKNTPDKVLKVREIFSDITPGQRLNKVLWSTVYLDHYSLPDSQFYALLDNSYQLVYNHLPTEVRHHLAG